MDMIDPKSIEDLKSIIDLVKDDPLLLLAIPIIIIFILLYKAKPIISFMSERKKSKLVNITNALECEYIDKTTKEFLEKEIINEHFYLSKRIKVDEYLRIAIIETHQKAEGRISFVHFKRGLQYISYNAQNKLLQVKIAPWDRYANWFLISVSVLLLFLALVLLLAPIATGNTNLILVSKSLITGSIFMAGALLSFYQTFAYFSGCKIREELNRQLLPIEK